MSEKERSLIAYDYWKDSSQRFDYFVTGLIGAVVAFIAQSYAPQKLGFNSNTLELISLLVLLSAFICAFKKIEASTEAFRKMSERLNAIEFFEKITKALLQGQPFIDLKSGEVFNAQTAEHKKQKLQLVAETAHKAAENLGDRSRKLYLWRNNLLFIGFILLLLSKVLRAYSAG